MIVIILFSLITGVVLLGFTTLFILNCCCAKIKKQQLIKEKKEAEAKAEAEALSQNGADDDKVGDDKNINL